MKYMKQNLMIFKEKTILLAVILIFFVPWQI